MCTNLNFLPKIFHKDFARSSYREWPTAPAETHPHAYKMHSYFNVLYRKSRHGPL